MDVDDVDDVDVDDVDVDDVDVDDDDAMYAWLQISLESSLNFNKWGSIGSFHAHLKSYEIMRTYEVIYFIFCDVNITKYSKFAYVFNPNDLFIFNLHINRKFIH